MQKGREAQEKEKREREKSEVDLELDFLAPFLVKFGDLEKMTRQQALQVTQNYPQNKLYNQTSFIIIA